MEQNTISVEDMYQLIGEKEIRILLLGRKIKELERKIKKISEEKQEINQTVLQKTIK